MSNIISFFGIFGLLFIAYAFSANRKKIDKKLVITGTALQLVLALLVLGIPALGFKGPLRFIFDACNNAVIALLSITQTGSAFLFGDLADNKKYGFIFAFQVLPIIIFMSALMAALYHMGAMQKLVDGFAKLMHKTMKVSGAESLSTSANIFFGQTEAPLVIRPFLAKMTQSELFCVMVGGMANVAGSVLGAYTILLRDKIPDIAGHLITASVLSAPATLVISKIMFPEVDKPETDKEVPEEYKNVRLDVNLVEAIARGASEGMMLAINVAAMLIAFIAVINMVDAILISFGQWVHFNEWGAQLVPELLLAGGKEAQLSFSLIAGWLFAPIAYIMGIPWNEALVSGFLLGQKVILNEFVAYMNLSQIMGQLSDRTVVILSYALCGFANFSSIGIQIGGIGALAPDRRKDLAKLGIKAVIGGSLCTFIVAAIAGMLI